MRNIKTSATVFIALVITSALTLSGYLNGDARADYAWSVGSQLSQMEASGNNVYVLWQNNSPDQNVYLRRSTDGGATFDRVIKLSNSTSAGVYAANPHMAISGNYVYVAWMDNRQAGENSKVLFRRSTDGGATFGNPQALGNDPKIESGIQRIFASGNNVYAVSIDYWNGNNTSNSGRNYYYDAKLWVSRDNGKTFGEPISLLPHLSHWNAGGISSVAVSHNAKDNVIYVAGIDYGDCYPEQPNCSGDEKIFFRRSTDGGDAFSEPVTIARPPSIIGATKSNNETKQQPPPSWLQLAANSDGSHVSIVWGEYIFSEARGAIFLAQSRNGGKTFEEAVQLNTGEGKNGESPLLFTSSDSAYVAWSARNDDGSHPYTALVRINGYGATGKPVNAFGETAIPAWNAAASGRNVYVAGSKNVKNISGLPDGMDIYFSASNDGGSTFGNPVDLSDDSSIKMLFAAQKKPLSFVSPQIAASETHVYVGWQPMYPDSSGLFFRASNDGGRTFGKIINLNEEASEPVSRGLSFFAEYGIYLILPVAVIIAVSLVIIFAKRRGGIR